EWQTRREIKRSAEHRHQARLSASHPVRLALGCAALRRLYAVRSALAATLGRHRYIRELAAAANAGRLVRRRGAQCRVGGDRVDQQRTATAALSFARQSWP